MTRRLAGILFAIALATVALAARQDGAMPVLHITSPPDGSYVSGPLTLKATVDTPSRVSAVLFFADGKQVCRVEKPPYQCDWNAGAVVTSHEIRVVAQIVGGGRIVQNIRTKGTTYADSVDVPVVQVTATVGDSGHFVRNLPKSAFHVYEDGVEQKITNFATSDVPLDLVVAVDISSSMEPSTEKLKAAVKEFLQAVPSKDRVTLLGFNANIYTLAENATDPARRIAEVDKLAPWGFTALYDVILHSLDLLADQTGRKAIVVFTDGEDQGSHSTLAQVEERLQESDATAFLIGQGRGTTLAALKKLMTRLADPTGGRAIFTDNIDDLKGVFAQLLDELSNQYMLGFAPTSKRDGAWHEIKVKVDGYSHVRARKGYRALPAR